MMMTSAAEKTRRIAGTDVQVEALASVGFPRLLVAAHQDLAWAAGRHLTRQAAARREVVAQAGRPRLALPHSMAHHPAPSQA